MVYCKLELRYKDRKIFYQTQNAKPPTKTFAYKTIFLRPNKTEFE